jgi:hypothetical protein
MSHLPLDFLSSCNKHAVSQTLCDACQIGKHTKLPSSKSHSHASSPFDFIHCDLWTSPILSCSGYTYYLVILDEFLHFCWVFPLRAKSDTCDTLLCFFIFVANQFHTTIWCLQCDNGGEFLTTNLRTYLSSHGVALLLSCPYKSPQNGRADHMIYNTNDVV